MNRKFTIAWVVIIGAGLAVEGLALAYGGRGDTLTEHVRAATEHPVLFIAGLGAAVWAVWHLFFQGRK